MLARHTADGDNLGGSHADHLPGLRGLCITNCNLRDWGLVSMLSRCKALESLIFEAGTFPVSHQPMMSRMST